MGFRSYKAAVFVHNGTEEMEAVITADVLRRAGIEVQICSLEGTEAVICSRQVKIVPDTNLDAIMARPLGFDVVVLPGGLGGAEAFATSDKMHSMLRRMESIGSIYVASICAAPIALMAAGVFFGKRLTSHPCVKTQLEDKYTYCDDEDVCVDGFLITSRGPGTTFEFALTIVEKLKGVEAKAEIKEQMMLK